MSHTHGPWRVVPMNMPRTRGGMNKAEVVCDFGNGFESVAEVHFEEDADLIAAAPELLSAAEAARSYMDIGGLVTGGYSDVRLMLERAIVAARREGVAK